MRNSLLLICFIGLLLDNINALRAQPFVHPGGLHNQADLDRIRYMVQVGAHPWIDSYNVLAADPKSSYNYTVQGNSTLTVVTRDAPSTNLSKWYSDANAAYYNALMYVITGDVRHAQKSVQIFTAWSNLTQVTGGGTESLNGGLLGFLMIEAAEIIQSTYSGWDATAKQRFKDMLVYPGYSTTTIPPTLSATNGTFYWRIYLGDPGRHGNQDLAGIRTMLSMAVFLDNRTMYNRALRYYEGLPHLAGDFPFASGPSTNTSLVSSTSYSDTYNYTQGTTIPDYGYNGVLTNYFWTNGQCQESSRDQGHTSLGGSLCQCIAEIAWHQGDDVYSLANNRLLLGLNYMTKYNVSYIASYTDQLTPWQPTAASGEYIQAFDRTHRWYSKRINPWNDGDTTTLTRGYNSIIPPVWEMAIGHYSVRQGLSRDSLQWVFRARDKSIDSVGYESHAPGTTDADHPGYGALTCRRPDSCAGDPISGFTGSLPVFGMHILPGTVEAEQFDYYPGNGEMHTFHDLSAGNTTGKYRTDASVDIDTCSEGGYALASLETGEWITYTVFVPTTGNYTISLRYATAASGGKIKCTIGGIDKTGEVAIPFGANGSTGITDWHDLTLAGNVQLTAGVQALRLYVTGVSNAFVVNRFTISNASTLPVTITSFTASLVSKNLVQLNWHTTNEVNNDHFSMETGTDAVNWQLLATVPPAITGNYTLYDTTYVQGYHYYRLSQVDKDGSAYIAGIQSVKIGADARIVVYPNPVNGNSFYVRYARRQQQPITVTVTDAAGKTIYRQLLPASANGLYRVQLPVTPAKGMYWVRLDNGDAAQLFVN